MGVPKETYDEIPTDEKTRLDNLESRIKILENQVYRLLKHHHD